ncbi:MAG: hypothetical protein EPO26_15145 [Chloroflexota bacterium]|nr:MAG: hypothetical protein EPO26_15145 [Chloroflexota bacterium]
MTWRDGVRHPIAWILLVASLVIASAILIVPSLARWSDRATLTLAIGLLSFLATAAVVAWPRGRSSTPAMRHAWAVRRAVAERLNARRAVDRDAPSTFGRALAEALDQLDRRLLPTLEEVVLRHERLGAHLARYQRGELPEPESAAMTRLRGLYERQADAIAEFLRQAANADAALLALEQESHDTAAIEAARRWAGFLVSMHDTLIDVLGDDRSRWERRLNANSEPSEGSREGQKSRV